MQRMASDSHAGRWCALAVLCLGVLMIVLDMTIVNVALPSIRTDLKFSEASLAWVVDAYLLTSGGFLLLGGRLGDLFGHRRLFLIGIAIFTLASLACGLAGSRAFLVAARALQGFGSRLASSFPSGIAAFAAPENPPPDPLRRRSCFADRSARACCAPRWCSDRRRSSIRGNG
jgi:MFS family permease